MDTGRVRDVPRKPWVAIAIAALAMAAVVAAPSARQDQPAREEREIPRTEAPRGGAVPGADGATTPPVVLPPATRTTPGGGVAVVPTGSLGVVPALVFAAYERAAAAAAVTTPGCHLPFALLAAIGKVESGHARGGRVDATGTTPYPILGPRLDGGPGLAAIADTDLGRYDGDDRWDRAVGPMQFIPGTWQRWATDGNRDGNASPHNVFDAAGAAGRYLCAGGRDLATGAGLDAAVLSYNNSASYLRIVRTWMALYQRSTVVVPDVAGLPTVPEPAPLPPAPPGTTTPAPPAGTPAPPTSTPVPPGTPGDPAPPSQSPVPPPPGDVLPGTVGGLVGGVVCVVDGVLDGTTGLLGGLLGLPVTPGPGDQCP